jgi:hypothetical protein
LFFSVYLSLNPRSCFSSTDAEIVGGGIPETEFTTLFRPQAIEPALHKTKQEIRDELIKKHAVYDSQNQGVQEQSDGSVLVNGILVPPHMADLFLDPSGFENHRVSDSLADKKKEERLERQQVYLSLKAKR